jgi:hypothetical protein
MHATAAPNSSTRIAAVLCVLLMAGCAGTTPVPTSTVPPVAASIDTPVATLPASEPPAPAPTVTAVPDAAAPASPPTTPPATGSVRPEPARPATSISRAPAKPTAAPAAAPLAQAQTPAAAVAKPPAAPPLDLKALEARLKETKAIGVFTKLTLKNQVDDLLSQFRDYYQGKLKATLVELRRSYDLLVLKVLALLQDADPPLAVAIASSRESIWGILSNRAKFAAV